MNAITIGRRHNGKWEVMSDPNVSTTTQISQFRDTTATGQRTHPTYNRIELHTLANAERFVAFDAPSEPKPFTATTESKGKTK